MRTTDEALIAGENGSEVILSKFDEKRNKLEIQKGYNDFAFNAFISDMISLGKILLIHIKEQNIKTFKKKTENFLTQDQKLVK